MSGPRFEWLDRAYVVRSPFLISNFDRAKVEADGLGDLGCKGVLSKDDSCRITSLGLNRSLLISRGLADPFCGRLRLRYSTVGSEEDALSSRETPPS